MEVRCFDKEEFVKQLDEMEIRDISILDNSWSFNDLTIVFNTIVSEAFVQAERDLDTIHVVPLQFTKYWRGYLQGRKQRIYIDELFSMNFWKEPKL